MIMGSAILCLLAGVEAAVQDAPAVPRTFSLADRVWVTLTSEWTERRNEEPPPDELLPSAPRLIFSDALVLENRKTESVLKVAISENPFVGSDAASLDARMHTGSTLAENLFYFFFPPPRNCLVRAKAAWEAARREEERQLFFELQQQAIGAGGTRVRAAPPPQKNVSVSCEFAATPLDFYAEQLSPSVTFTAAGRAAGTLRNLYVPPMEQVEIRGWTFYVFEAQGQQLLGRAELDHFNLPESLHGARAHFFWAIGAESPFPFAQDPLRKNPPLVHVAYGVLSTTGTAIADFREKLHAVRFGLQFMRGRGNDAAAPGIAAGLAEGPLVLARGFKLGSINAPKPGKTVG